MFRRVQPRLDRSLELAVRSIASDSDLWLPRVRFAEPRSTVRLDVRVDAEPDVEAWLLTWMPGQATGFHDHGGAGGVFTVLRGRIAETWVDPAGRFRTRRYGRGRVRSFGADHVHEVFNDGSLGAVTLHLYRPALVSMTRYERDEDGLRPVHTALAGVDW